MPCESFRGISAGRQLRGGIAVPVFSSLGSKLPGVSTLIVSAKLTVLHGGRERLRRGDAVVAAVLV